MPDTPPVFRFAPSPNGLLHLGHALSAVLNHDMAKATKDRWGWILDPTSQDPNAR